MRFGGGELIVVLFWLVAMAFWFGIVVAAVYVGTKLAMRPPKNFKKCPLCSEMIPPDATICRACGREYKNPFVDLLNHER